MKFALAGAGMLCAAALMIGAGGQPVGATAGQDKMGQDKMGQDKMGQDKMSQDAKTHVMDKAYTGCLEAGKAPRTYVLTHLAAAGDHMGKDAMSKDAMSKNATETTTFLVSSQAVDLSKHVGHKVSVTGTASGKADAMGKDSMMKETTAKDSMGKDSMSAEAPAFTIKTLKTLASSCQ